MADRALVAAELDEFVGAGVQALLYGSRYGVVFECAPVEQQAPVDDFLSMTVGSPATITFGKRW
jgi:hypothetical protein